MSKKKCKENLFTHERIIRARLNMSVRRFLDRIGIWKSWFFDSGEGKTGVPGEKNSTHIRRPCQDLYTRVLGRRGGEGRLLELIFAGYVQLASQSPYPIIIHSVANRRPHLSHFWANV